MQIEGQIRTSGPAEKLVPHLTDPEVLRQIVPQGLELGARTADSVSFVISRKFGPINLHLPGKMSVSPKPDSKDWSMKIHASHLIGGSVDIVLDITPGKMPNGSGQLAWNGTLESHGLASRLVQDRKDQAQTFVKTLFQRLRSQTEGEAPTAGPSATRG